MPPKLRREVAEKAGAYYTKVEGRLLKLGGSPALPGKLQLERTSEFKAAVWRQQIHKWKTSSVFQESGVQGSQVEGRCVLLFRRVLP